MTMDERRAVATALRIIAEVPVVDERAWDEFCLRYARTTISLDSANGAVGPLKEKLKTMAIECVTDAIDGGIKSL